MDSAMRRAVTVVLGKGLLGENWMKKAPPWKNTLILAALFLVVHAIYYLTGLRTIDLSIMKWSWPFIDPHLLKNRPLESLLYLHTQPPLQNACLSLLVQLPDYMQSPVHTMVNCLWGFGFYFSVYTLMVSFGVARTISTVLSTVFMASPSFVLLEHSISYDFIVAAMMAISAVFLLRFLRSRMLIDGFAFFGIIGMLCLTRSLFHLVFLVLSVLFLCIRYREHARVVLLSACVPLLLVTAWYGKNYVLLDSFSSSSWMGMNAWKVIERSTTREQRENWVKEGVCSKMALIDTWSELSSYPDKYAEVDTRFAGVPALTEPEKSNGHKNLNHFGYVAIADQYLEDAISIAIRHPLSYLKGLAAAWFCYFRSTDESIFLPFREDFSGLVAAYNYVLYGKSPWPISFKTERKDAYNIYIFILVGLPLVFLYGLRLWFSEEMKSRDQRTVLLYMMLAIAFVAVTINTFELAENQRSRFYTDAFSLTLFAHFCQTVFRRVMVLRPGILH